MAEKDGLILNKRWYGISLDEYNWGSYLFSKWIKACANRFTLDGKVTEENINYRATWDLIALVTEKATVNKCMFGFTKDWYIEWEWRFNELSFINWYTSGYGSYPEWQYWKSDSWYVNAITCWDYTVWIRANKIDIMKFNDDSWFGLFGTNLVTNPWITSNTWWTVGSWWTTWANGATHATGWWVTTIVQDITTAGTWKLRISFLVSAWTTGNVACFYNYISLGQISATRNWLWNLYVDTATGAADSFWFIPSDDFDWTITFCDARELDSLESDKETITPSTAHPAYYDSPFLYIGSGSTLDIIDTTTWVCESRDIIEWWFNIVSINRLWDKILIWASDGKNSKQYYWDWVSEQVLETVDWVNKNITNCVVDWNKAYVMVENWYHKSVYLVNWYDNTMLATSKKNTFSDYATYNKKRTDIYGKFNFHSYNSNSMICFDDYVAISWYNWVYLYGIDNPTEQSKFHYIYTWVSQFLNSTEITALWFKNIYPYASYKKNTTSSWNSYNILANYSYGNYARNWYMITNPILWDDFSSRKTLNKLKIWYKSLSSSIGNIKLYAQVDDDFFWTAYITSALTVAPVVWDKYQINVSTIKWEVIAVDLTDWVGTITLKTYDNTYRHPTSTTYSGTLTKIEWDGDTTISYSDLDNFVLLKTITEDQQKYNQTEIFSQAFIDAHMPYWHKINLKIELNTTSPSVAPEVWDIGILSDITW